MRIPTQKEMDENNYLGGYECDCNVADPVVHALDCRLQESWDFECGWAAWDAARGCLVWAVEPRPPDAPDDLDDLDDEWAALADAAAPVVPVAKSTSGIPYTPYVYVAKCRHFQEALKLPDDTVVYASSAHRDRQGDPIPDLGIYLDGVWTPDCIAFYVGCPDYGVPVPSAENVLHIANEGLRVAREGGRVEIGCIGGHGRTGMMLAIMVALTQRRPNAKRAIAYVRKHYCDHAVEAEVQEWYVAGIVAEITGKPWPAKPEPKKYTYTTATWTYPATVPAGIPPVATAASTTLIPLTPPPPVALLAVKIEKNVDGLMAQIKGLAANAVMANAIKQVLADQLEHSQAEYDTGNFIL